MLEPDLIQLFVEPLERLGIRYLISGSVAATVSGEQLDRTTMNEWIQRRGLDGEWQKASS